MNEEVLNLLLGGLIDDCINLSVLKRTVCGGWVYLRGLTLLVESHDGLSDGLADSWRRNESSVSPYIPTHLSSPQYAYRKFGK